MKSAHWKNIELRIGRYLGGDRNPITGRVRDNTIPDIGKAKHSQEVLPDADQYIMHPNYTKILNGWLFDLYNFEIKHRKSLPKYILNLYRELKDTGECHYYDRFTIQSLATFRNYFFELRVEQKEVYEKLEFPAWIMDAKNQAEMSTTDNQQPVVILHGKNQKIKDSLVITWYIK